MTGFCVHCRAEGDVARYRIADLGLRTLHPSCAERLSAMGMAIEAVAEMEPRSGADRRANARPWSGLGRRLSLRAAG